MLNEYALRAGAGITFLCIVPVFLSAFFLEYYLPLMVVVVLLWVDFATKLVFSPRYSVVSRCAQWVVRHKPPRMVPAASKRFAWGIGFTLASTMMVLLFVLDIRGTVNLLVCTLCMSFMFLESIFGFCVGCAIYSMFAQKGDYPAA
ncbi:MAG: DUF4395 domain-containing protein [Candidatus Pacebacteria bacterium]|nr:DUF4395 domain-containing protein [Candidatus Paceibacterota bacterium]